MPRYDAIIDATVRMRNSVAIEIGLLAVSTTLGYWIWRQHVSLHVGTWYAAVDAAGEEHLTLAGWWYAFVSLNLFRFVLFRWYYRMRHLVRLPLAGVTAAVALAPAAP